MHLSLIDDLLHSYVSGKVDTLRYGSFETKFTYVAVLHGWQCEDSHVVMLGLEIWQGP